jgi:hypothetical protein
MRVWLVLDHDTIDSTGVVLAVCASEAVARAKVEEEVQRWSRGRGTGVNAIADGWARAGIEPAEVIGA